MRISDWSSDVCSSDLFETPDGRKVAFPGTSKLITNLSLFYEKYGFSARVGYQHRTDWLDDISVDATQDIFWDATERVDLSVRYEIVRSEEHTSELQSLMRISYAVFCLKKKTNKNQT